VTSAVSAPRGECVACHNRSVPVENGVIARHANPNPFLSITCLGSGRPPVTPRSDLRKHQEGDTP
jgi:hypothetical protein